MRFFGTVIGALVYTFTTMLITAAKRREFGANFKRQIIENIVKKHGLSYDKDRGLTNNFGVAKIKLGSLKVGKYKIKTFYGGVKNLSGAFRP